MRRAERSSAAREIGDAFGIGEHAREFYFFGGADSLEAFGPAPVNRP